MTGNGPMHFDRYGHTYQFRIRTAEDLEQVLALDDSLWIAMSAPVAGLHCDKEFLAFVDLDEDGRIRTDEIRAAVRWLLERLADRSRLAEGTDRLELPSFNASHPDGQRLLDTAGYILDSLRVEPKETITIGQIEAFKDSLGSSAINGDGVITPEATEDESIRGFIADVVSCMGGQEDLTGRTGITQQDLDRFLDEAEKHLTWLAEADIPEGQQSTEVMPLGEATPAAYSAFAAVRAKVEEFFARCRMLRFRPDQAQHVGEAGGEPVELSDAESINAVLARAPLAEPNTDGLLRSQGAVNPVYRAALEMFRERAVVPLSGETTELSEAEWERVKAVFAPHEQWLAGTQGTEVERLCGEKLRLYLDGPFAEVVGVMLAADTEVAKKLGEARELKRLLLYHKYLLQLANNFVSFPDLYDPARRALFEMGALVIDGRWFNFAVKVDDLREHSKLAKTSAMYVMYAELARADQTEGLIVAVPATSGTVGNICVGKRGVFYDTEGRHYDARVVQIIENPISFREALVAPFVRLSRFISGKMQAIAGSPQKKLESQVGAATRRVRASAQKAVQPARQGPAAAAPSAGPTTAARRDMLLGVSVSIAALSSALAFITKQLSSSLEKPLYLALAVAGVILAIFVPTAVAAAIKLSRRDLSAILEGCGWAINARMRLNRRQRHQFTHYEGFPAGATGIRGSRLRPVLLLLIILAVLAFGATSAWRARRAASHIIRSQPDAAPAGTPSGSVPAQAAPQ